METVFKVLLILHFIGLASLLGGFLGQMSAKDKIVTAGMFHGVLTQVVTGFAMVGLLASGSVGDDEPNNLKFAIKLGIAWVVGTIIVIYRKKPSISTALWGTIGGLTILNVVIAVAWR